MKVKLILLALCAFIFLLPATSQGSSFFNSGQEKEFKLMIRENIDRVLNESKTFYKTVTILSADEPVILKRETIKHGMGINTLYGFIGYVPMKIKFNQDYQSKRKTNYKEGSVWDAKIFFKSVFYTSEKDKSKVENFRHDNLRIIFGNVTGKDEKEYEKYLKSLKIFEDK